MYLPVRDGGMLRTLFERRCSEGNAAADVLGIIAQVSKKENRILEGEKKPENSIKNVENVGNVDNWKAPIRSEE